MEPGSPPSSVEIEDRPGVFRRLWRRKGRIVLVGFVAGIAVYNLFYYPASASVTLADGTQADVLGATREWRWESDRGRTTYLELSIVTGTKGLFDTTAPSHGSHALTAYAETLAVRNHEPVVSIDRVAFPLSRGLPFRIDSRTYFHRRGDGTWVPVSNPFIHVE